MIYLRAKELNTIDNETKMNFDDGIWQEVDKLTSFGYVGISHLSPPQQARYVAIKRIGLINLKEVGIYQRTSKKFMIQIVICKHRNRAFMPNMII